jgi:hypothetical protein
VRWLLGLSVVAVVEQCRMSGCPHCCSSCTCTGIPLYRSASCSIQHTCSMGHGWSWRRCHFASLVHSCLPCRGCLAGVDVMVLCSALSLPHLCASYLVTFSVCTSSLLVHACIFPLQEQHSSCLRSWASREGLLPRYAALRVVPGGCQGGVRGCQGGFGLGCT